MRVGFFIAAGVVLAAAAAGAGCRSDGKKDGRSSCTVVERTVGARGDALEVAVSVTWSVAGKNYRTNKPIAVGRFDASQHTRAALEERFKPGTEVPCAIDPARPTRVDLPDLH